MLKIPTIADRCWQCLAKYALEPAHEALFHKRSYGFRPGRSAHDAQKILFINLRSHSNGINKRVIELDIEKCFDRICHTTIMENLIAPKGIKSGIFRCLKAGVNPEFPEQGTPQVAWRDQKDCPVIMERYCSHMDASLTIGKVQEGCIHRPATYSRYYCAIGLNPK